MSEETRLAFDTLEARSIASATVQPRDRIAVRDYEKSVEIGAFQSERGVVQGLRFNVVLEVDGHDGAVSDDVDAVLSYDTITEAIEGELAAERLNLLETLADRIAARILQHALAMRVFVRIEKTERGPGSLGVEIVRDRDDGAVSGPDDMVRPTVIFMPRGVANSDRVNNWIDAIEAKNIPVVLCVETADDIVPTGVGEPDQRLRLLAIEAAAWRLAACDPRCVVVGTRTELDWALKNGQTSVWAPSRIVMDAVDQPPAEDAVGLALWFADAFSGSRVVALESCEDARLDVVQSSDTF